MASCSRAFPERCQVPMLVQAIVAAITALAAENLAATVVVVEPGRIRIRRSSRS
jgi:hypothetical protein